MTFYVVVFSLFAIAMLFFAFCSVMDGHKDLAIKLLLAGLLCAFFTNDMHSFDKEYDTYKAQAGTQANVIKKQEATIDSLGNRVDTLKESTESLKQTQKQMTNDLAVAQNKTAQALSKVSTISTENNILRAELEAERQRVGASQVEMDAVRAANAQLQAQLDAIMEAVND